MATFEELWNSTPTKSNAPAKESFDDLWGSSPATRSLSVEPMQGAISYKNRTDANPDWSPEMQMASKLGYYPSAKGIMGKVRDDFINETAVPAAGLALELGGAMLAPELLPLRVAKGAGLLGRLGGYLANSAASAGGAYVGRQGAQELGAQPELTNEEELNRAGLDAAIGFGIPAAFDVGKTGLAKALGFLNEPKTTARILGATSSDFNPMKEAVTIDQNISSLTKASPVQLASAEGASVKPFADILQESDPAKLKDLSTERLKAVGQEIRDIYSRNKGLSIDKSALLDEPSIKKYLDMLDSPDVSKGQKRIVKRSINELQSVLDNYDGKIPLNTLWGQAKAFGGDIPAQFSSDLNDQVTNSIRKGLKSAIDKTLTTGKSPDLANLKSLNREFFDLLPVTETIAKKYSQEAGQIPFIPTSPSLGGIIKGLMQAPVGPARAFAYGANKSPGSPISPQALIAALQAYPELTNDE